MTGRRIVNWTPAAAKAPGNFGSSLTPSRRRNVQPVAKSTYVLHIQVCGRHPPGFDLRLGDQLQDAALQAFDQLAWCAGFQNFPLIHEQHTVEAAGFIHIRRADQHCRAGAQKPDQQVPEFLPGNRVDAACRLVQ